MTIVGRALAKVRALYGSHPLHLLLLLAGFALAAYTVFLLRSNSQLPWMAVWFCCALVGHDLVLFPLYALLDRALGRRRRGSDTQRLPLRNYIRVPALGAVLLLLLFLPGIIEQGAGTYLAATGQTQDPFLARWLLCTAALFVISAAVYAARTARAGRRERAAEAEQPRGE